jgi:hypothetical protein
MATFTRKGTSNIWLYWCLVLSLCITSLARSAGAQVQTTTSITGIVSDPSGGVVPGASVTVKEQNTGVTHVTKTDVGGSYSFPSLLPGIYTVTVTYPGFQTAIVTNREVLAAQPAHVDITLQIGSTNTSVTVSAAGAELTSTSSSQIASLVSPRLVQTIPLNGLDYFNLATLTPGAVPQNASTRMMTFAGNQFVQAGNTFVATGIMLGGNRDSGTNVSIDGINTQIPVYQQSTQIQSPYDIQELQIQTGTMNAEFGNGVSAVNVITKAGTNSYHGQLYEYFRNNNLDAAPFFTNLVGHKLPFYDQNQFGASFGGPIKKDKLFFFGNYEGYRLIQDATAIEQVPNTALRNGDFSQFQRVPGKGVGTIYNPYQSNPQTSLRTPFPGNVIPLGATSLCSPRPTCVDPVVLKFLQTWVVPANGTFNGLPAFIGTARTNLGRDQGTVRLDWAKSEKATVYGRWTDYKGTSFAAGVQPLEGTGNPFSSQQAVAHWTESISSSVVNDLMLGYSRPKWGLQPKTNVPDVSAQIGLQNVRPGPGGPQFSGTEFTLDPGYVFAFNATDNKIQVKDDLSWSKSRHTFKFGGEIINSRFIYPTLSDFKGAFSFGDYFSAACPEVNPTCTAALGGTPPGGDPFADFLLGGISYGIFQNNPIEYVGHQTYYGIYAQDSWRATRKLTLNYGLRYEYWSPWLVPSNITVSFNFATGNIEYALQNPLDYLNAQKCFGACAPLNPAIPRQGYRVGNLDLAPRAGLAYSLTSNTVVRAGFGVYFDGNANNNQFSNIQTGAAPFFLRTELTPDLSLSTPQYLVSQLFPPSGPTSIPTPNSTPPSTFRFVMPYYPTPAVDQWSFSIQRQINSYWEAEVDYLGSHTVHEPMFIDENAPALPQGSYAGLSLQARRRYPQWGTLGSWIPIGWAKYNALMAGLKNREWHGLSLIANWTWAKNIATSNVAASDQGDTNFRFPYIHAGPSALTPTQFFTGGYTYRVPVGPGQRFANSSNPVLGKLVGGWAVSGITTFASGTPEPVLAPDVSNTAEGRPYPNRVAGCNPNNVPSGRTRFEWFNTSCFVLPPSGTIGNSTEGAFTDPGINNWDISILKDTRTSFPRESGDLQFRADFFNAFNHTQFGSPCSTLISCGALFGQISSTRPARIIQFVLQYSF